MLSVFSVLSPLLLLLMRGKSGTIVFYPYIMTSRSVTTFSRHESVNEDSRLDGL